MNVSLNEYSEKYKTQIVILVTKFWLSLLNIADDKWKTTDNMRK